MTLSVLINLILIIILLVCAWQGFRKGVIAGLAEMLAVLIALLGAGMLSDAFSYEIVDAAEPFVSGYMDDKIAVCVYEELGLEPDDNGEYHPGVSLADLLAESPDVVRPAAVRSLQAAGFYSSLSDSLADDVVTYMQSSGADLVDAVVYVICSTGAWFIGYAIAFFLLLAVLLILLNITNLGFRFPYIGLVNEIAGLIVGIVLGMLVCSVLMWMVQYCGLLLPESKLAGSGVAQSIWQKNLLANWLS